ncbi:Inversin (Inversion of embryo turning homolog) (Nephrocystin-2) [Durusdinium trenchii]|uniref:Inversin (Inversion of embryo turning homolog) (Nephrocystin-2) n=1 Tax=Durusdinium trenchii TaxID=1381693 RepID=A0ABP0P4H0_9DINO
MDGVSDAGDEGASSDAPAPVDAVPVEAILEDEEPTSPITDLDDVGDTAADATAAAEDTTERPNSQEDTPERKKAPEGLVWVPLAPEVYLHNSKTIDRFKHVKALVPKDLTLTELRHFLCPKVGCPFKELQIEIEGKQMWAGREMPLVEAEDREYRIKWRRVNRVSKLMQAKKIGGINGLSAEHGRTVLHFIALNGDSELFREALSDPKGDAELINVRDKLGDTALTIAAITGYVDILATCLEREADVETKNLKGRTALLLAAEHGHSDAVQTLLHANADLDPSHGTTCPSAMYLAELNQRSGVLRTIRQYLADTEGPDEF